MNQNQNKTANDFFDKVRDRCAKKQQQIVKATLIDLFGRSPHASFESHSESQYDANHKITINNGSRSSHHSATGSAVASAAHISSEIVKANQIDCGDSVLIFNTTAHARDVELGIAAGGNYWRKSGYYTYTTAKGQIKEEFENVLK